MLVNDMVTKVKQHSEMTEESEHKGKKAKNQLASWDTFSEWSNFAAIITKLNELLLDEDPLLAERMGIIQGPRNENTKFGVGTLENDDEEEGLELQIQMYVEKFTKEQDERVALKLQE